MASQRPPGRGNFPPRGPRPTSGHAGTRRPRPATGGSSSSERPGPQARREAQPSRPKTSSPRKPRPPQGDPGADRLQKILAHAGVGSRRACEEMILQGRVSVGGQIIRELGTKVDLGKISVAVDGQKIQQERLVYFAVNKPKGYVSTNNDPSGRPRVLDLMPEIAQRVYTVGRLDEMSVGLMLLTNDGELANKLAHPRFGVEKLYRVIVAGTPERETLNQLTDGIWLAEGKVRAKRVRAVAKKGDATILEMVLAEGKNREVRRMLAKLGHKVMMLTRVAVGPITLKGLAAGQFRPLTGREVDLLRRVAAGEPVPMPWATDRRPPRPDADRPRRPVGPGSGPSSRRDTRDTHDQARPGGPPPRSRGGDRPHGPGYRGDDVPRFEDRPAGPPPQRFPNRDSDRRPGGRPGRPGMFEARPDDGDIRPREDRRPPQSQRPPQRRSASGPRPGGPRPYNDRPQQGSRGGPRPAGPSGGRSQDTAQVDNRRDQSSNGPRRSAGDDRRQNDRRPPLAGRRMPIAGSSEPTRKVIGMNSAPSPAPAQETGDDRPKPRMKRPAPRGAALGKSRLIRKPRPGQGDD